MNTANDEAQPTLEPVSTPMLFNPYPGLRPFDVSEEVYFFGRKTQIRDIVDRLRKNHFAAILGGSGCGKSSLILAGVLPELLAGGIGGAAWVPIVLRPGESPVKNLAAAFYNRLDPAHMGALTIPELCRLLEQRNGLSDLATIFHNCGSIRAVDDGPRQQAKILFVIDQFEEIFRPRNLGSKDVATLVNLILDVFDSSPDHVYVILTMRSEDLHSCAGFIGLPEALNRCCYLVPRLRDTQLRDVIVKPAERYAFGVDKEFQFAHEVWVKIIEETLPLKDDPDHLPLLQHLLFHLWSAARVREAKTGNPTPERILWVDLVAAVQPAAVTAGYDHLLARCLNNRAEELYGGLGLTGQSIAEKMLTLMGFMDSNGVFKRNFVSEADICAATGAPQEQVKKVIGTFTYPHSYIRISDAEALDVSHEAFIRKWNRFADWITQDREKAQRFGGVYPEFSEWAQGLKAAQERSTLPRLGRRWMGLLGWKDLRRLRVSSVDKPSVSDVRRWIEYIDNNRRIDDPTTSPLVVAETSARADKIQKSFAQYVKLSRIRIACLVAGFVLAIIAPVWAIKDHLDGNLMRQLSMLPAVEGALVESVGTLAGRPRSGPDDPMPERMEALVGLTNSSGVLHKLSESPGMLGGSNEHDIYLIAQSRAQAQAFNSLTGALSQYLWEYPLDDNESNKIPYNDPAQNTECAGVSGQKNTLRGSLFRSSQNSRALLLTDDGTVYAVSTKYGPCRVLGTLTSFPPETQTVVDENLNVLVARVPNSNSAHRGWQWVIYLLQPDMVINGTETVETFAPLKSQAISWNESGPLGDPATHGTTGVRYQRLSDREFEVLVNDGAHLHRYVHLKDGLLPSKGKPLTWDRTAASARAHPDWHIYEIRTFDKPICNLPLSHDSDNFCFRIEHPKEEGPEATRPVYFIKLFLQGNGNLGTTHMMGEVASIVHNGATPQFLAVGSGKEEGKFRIWTSKNEELSGVWLSEPLQTLGRHLVGSWVAANCKRWSTVSQRPTEQTYPVLTELSHHFDAKGIDDLHGELLQSCQQHSPEQPLGVAKATTAAH